MPTRRAQAEETRHRILVAAADCIARDGLAAVTMSAVARAAGVSHGLAPYHFSTKEKLFVAVLEHTSAVSRELTQQALDEAGPSPAQRLMVLLERCLPSDPQLTRDWWLWQELDLLCLRQPDLAHVGAEVYQHLYLWVETVLLEGHSAGVFGLDPTRIRDVAESAVALCDGFGERVLAPDDLSLDEARRLVAYAVGRLTVHDGPLPVRQS